VAASHATRVRRATIAKELRVNRGTAVKTVSTKHHAMRPSRVPDQYQLARRGIDPTTLAVQASGTASPSNTRWYSFADSAIRISHRTGCRQEVIMADPARRAKLVRDLEQDFVPDYDAQNMPSGDKRAAYALEHIAFRVGRIEQSLARIAAAIESVLSKG
jgi:hypothetical protein